MKNFGYPLLLIISLIAAFWASSPEENDIRKREVWLDIPKSASYEIRYEDEKRFVTVTSDGWVKHEAIRDNTPMPPERFRANNYLEKVTGGLLKLFAEKVIGDSKDLKLEDYELAEGKKKFKIKAGSEEHEFLIGKRSFQTSNVYVLDKKKQKVILINREPFNFIRNPKARLFESKSYNFSLADDISKVQIVEKDKSLVLDKMKKQKGKVYWVNEGQEDENETDGSWLSNFMKLKIKRYPTDLEKTSLGKLEGLAKVEFLNGNNQVEVIEIFHWAKDASDAGTYWIRSQYIGEFGLVEQTKAQTILQDIQNLF